MSISTQHREIHIDLPLFKYVIRSSSNVGMVDTGASIENRQTLLSSNLKIEINVAKSCYIIAVDGCGTQNMAVRFYTVSFMH